jgi:hypothetical protein
MTNHIVKITFYGDAGHGWYRVKLSDAKKLGFLDKVSRYSYVRGASIYIEEDRDARLLFDAITTIPGVLWNIKTAKRVCRSPIRSFVRYESHQHT